MIQPDSSAPAEVEAADAAASSGAEAGTGADAAIGIDAGLVDAAPNGLEDGGLGDAAAPASLSTDAAVASRTTTGT